MSSSSSSTHLVTLVRADIATEMQPMRGQCAGHVICADQSEPGVGERRGSIYLVTTGRKSPELWGDVSGQHVWGRPRY